MIDYYETKEHPVNRVMVLEAFKKVKSSGGSGGIDGQSISDFEEGLSRNVYKLWNRMSSGSYHPSAIKEVLIPKKSGGTRGLGIPTVSDRVCQQVVKTYLERIVEPTFHPDSYGYRPGRNAHMAIQSATRRCSKIGWVLDVDISGFFDNIPHDLLLKAVEYYTQEKWILMYIERWLKADVVKQGTGVTERREKGTPQGGVISGLLANMFLHFTFDKWMAKYFPKMQFERYSDDIIVHCVSNKQAAFMKTRLAERLNECGLSMNEAKTKIVYCRNDRNRENPETASSFDFLGYTFKPRYCPTKDGLKLITAACMSESSKTSVRNKLRKFSIRKFRGNIQELSSAINVMIKGWINYYCKFHKWTTVGLWYWLNRKLIEWKMAQKRRLGKRKAIRWLETVYRGKPNLFAHWQLVPPTLGKNRRPDFGSAV
jgi:RNA-directed DNA polymerase